jgi:hypothetical protein
MERPVESKGAVSVCDAKKAGPMHERVYVHDHASTDHVAHPFLRKKKKRWATKTGNVLGAETLVAKRLLKTLSRERGTLGSPRWLLFFFP